MGLGRPCAQPVPVVNGVHPSMATGLGISSAAPLCRERYVPYICLSIARIKQLLNALCEARLLPFLIWGESCETFSLVKRGFQICSTIQNSDLKQSRDDLLLVIMLLLDHHSEQLPGSVPSSFSPCLRWNKCCRSLGV